jgi:hypothetical protein
MFEANKIYLKLSKIIQDVMSICFQKKLLQKDYICKYNLGWGLVCFHLEAL